MLTFVSVSDLCGGIRASIGRLPADIDLVVGIPRSGMLAAYIIGLYKNILVTDVNGFCNDLPCGHGVTREVGIDTQLPSQAKSLLLVDDSVDSGQSIKAALNQITQHGFCGKIATCAVIASRQSAHLVNFSFLKIPQPRLFEWNALHHSIVENSCFDMDGVLCCDPTESQNDDGPEYQRFLETASPLLKPTGKIGCVVSARLERYRPQTEQWLNTNGIKYGRLYLLQVGSKAERQRYGLHASYKATVFKNTGARLFYESDPGQAVDISNISGRPVLCTANMQLHLPGKGNPRAAVGYSVWYMKRIAKAILRGTT